MQAATMERNRRQGTRPGFSLVELMVAVSVTGMLVLSALYIFVQQRLVLKTNLIESEMSQNMRTAMDMISRDVRLAGYGLNIIPTDLPDWVDWAEDLSGSQITMDSNPKIIDGGTGSDSIWIAAAFEPPVATLTATANSGTFTLVLGTGEGSRFLLPQRKLIFIGKVETARIMAISGDTLTVSAHPTMALGLHHDHPRGTTIELVKVRSYESTPATINYPYRPYLTRDESSAVTFEYYWQRLIAAGVEDIQFQRTGDRVEIELTGVATANDRNYYGDEGGSKIRRKTMATSTLLRNPST